MAKAYFELRENLYNISKLLIKKNITTDNFIIENILNESIERYCSSLDNSIFKNFKKIFKKYSHNTNEINKYNVMDCIQKIL